MRNDNPLGQSLASKIENFSIKCEKPEKYMIRSFLNDTAWFLLLQQESVKKSLMCIFEKKTSFVHEIIP